MSAARAQARNLLLVTAAMELGIGFMLLQFPSTVVILLLGSALEGPVALTLARVAGVALAVLGLTCWLARDDGSSHAGRGLVAAVVLYNVAVAAVLAYANVGLGLSGIGLWPAVVLHAVMSAWSVTRVAAAEDGPRSGRVF